MNIPAPAGRIFVSMVCQPPSMSVLASAVEPDAENIPPPSEKHTGCACYFEPNLSAWHLTT
jgi:hypothetical protein